MLNDDVNYTIKRSKRKTLSIYIERDGTVSILAPQHLSEEKLASVVQAKEYQIYKYLAEWKAANAARIEREYVNGQSFLYLGRNYRLSIEAEQAVPLQLKNGYFVLNKNDAPKAKAHFIAFYKQKLLPRINDRIEHFADGMGVRPNKVRVMELQNRWASCTAQGNLNFHWKCGMAPLEVLDYIVVHEMAHLIYLNHSQAFWHEVDKALPQYRDHIAWLEAHGAGMDL
ncbi:M48 family metallopeptidase [Microscilla marina]|uniref:YgjP-like metallopeptidase domain-containing protein n=1 Tax=Microscilla marina ATCC 23134 TaxID=313606 RepID=A1ZTI5_MICM2|nr:SprT family zinc-dependent metalloprotease [Microscilla marina]EAY26245.1 protein of unknown function [Microscilla marina ATCC 23134]